MFHRFESRLVLFSIIITIYLILITIGKFTSVKCMIIKVKKKSLTNGTIYCYPLIIFTTKGPRTKFDQNPIFIFLDEVYNLYNILFILCSV